MTSQQWQNSRGNNDDSLSDRGGLMTIIQLKCGKLHAWIPHGTQSILHCLLMATNGEQLLAHKRLTWLFEIRRL
jgi:hypothetical protein